MKPLLFCNLLNSIFICSNTYYSPVVEQKVAVNQYVSLKTNWTFNMSINSFLSILEQWKFENNIILNLENFGFVIDQNVNQVILQKYELYSDLEALFCYFELTLSDQSVQIQKLSLDLNNFKIDVQYPSQINMTLDQFYFELEASEDKLKFLIDNGFCFGIDNNLLTEPNTFQINKEQNIINFKYLNYVDNQNNNIYQNINLNLNNTQFLVPSSATNLDVGSIVGISLSILSLIVIFSCTIFALVRKKKK